MKVLLENGAEPNFKQSELFRLPLSIAALAGNITMLKMLLDDGADVDGLLSGFPLYHAAKSRNLDVIKLLLDRGANPMARERAGVILTVDGLRDRGINEHISQILVDAQSKILFRNESE